MGHCTGTDNGCGAYKGGGGRGSRELRTLGHARKGRRAHAGGELHVRYPPPPLIIMVFFSRNRLNLVQRRRRRRMCVWMWLCVSAGHALEGRRGHAGGGGSALSAYAY
eukprot:1425413-Rhodomonas_salina.2